MKSSLTTLFLVAFIASEAQQLNDFPSTGNVGIGITGPTNRLEIRNLTGNSSDMGARILSQAGGAPYLELEATNSAQALLYGKWKIKVNGSGAPQGAFIIRDEQMSANRMVISSNFGYVGYGTDLPAKELHVKKAQPTLRLEATGGSNGQAWDIFSSGGTMSAHFSGNFYIYDVVRGVSPFAIHRASGETHINPTLIVDGGTKLNNNQIGIDGPSNFYVNNYAQGTGNVFIGKSSAGVVTVMRQLNVGSESVISTNTHKDAILQVSGKIACKELVVLNQNQWADFVFDADYQLPTLSEVSAFIREHHRLPDVPSAIEILESGNHLAKTDALLLQKIEELTLYIIAQEKEIVHMKNVINTTESKGD